MELTAESARQLIAQTMSRLGNAPDAEHLLAVCSRLQGMYDLLRAIPSFKASRYHPRMFPDAVAVEEMLVEAIEQVRLMQEQGRHTPGGDGSRTLTPGPDKR